MNERPTCERCGKNPSVERINAPACFPRPSMTICAKCYNAALDQGLLVPGRFRVTAICPDHPHHND